MSDDVKVKSMPFQRESLDVATELTQMYYSQASMEKPEQIQETFMKFYAIAETARCTNYRKLTQYLPDVLKTIVESSR